MDFVKHSKHSAVRTPLSSLPKTSFCGQVVCDPSFCGRQITRSHGNRLVVHSLLGRNVRSMKSRETVIPEPDYRIPIVLLDHSPQHNTCIILVYFKETQTKPEGQIHFFPIILNRKQLYDVMVERAGPKLVDQKNPED